MLNADTALDLKYEAELLFRMACDLADNVLAGNDHCLDTELRAVAEQLNDTADQLDVILGD